MVKFKKSLWTRERVILDGHHFEDSTFDHCVLVFSATAPVRLENCRFIACQWQFEGAAALTIDFLRALDFGGGDEVIAGLLPFSAEGRLQAIGEVDRATPPASASR
jgi:hypothetical protein